MIVIDCDHGFGLDFVVVFVAMSDDGMGAINRDDGSIAFSAWALQYAPMGLQYVNDNIMMLLLQLTNKGIDYRYTLRRHIPFLPITNDLL